MVFRETALELELILAGIGGQGIQLVGKTLALAATAEGRHALLYGEYGGEMRGGNSLMNVVIGARRLRGLPIVNAASHSLILNMKFWDEFGHRLRDDAVIFTDSSLAGQIPGGGRTIIAVPARELALEAGNLMSMGLALAGVFAKATGVVSADSLIAAMKQQVPSYRQQHIETNERAIRLGAAAVAPLASPFVLDAAA